MRDHVRAGPTERLGRGGADPLGGTGQQNRLPVEGARSSPPSHLQIVARRIRIDGSSPPYLPSPDRGRQGHDEHDDQKMAARRARPRPVAGGGCGRGPGEARDLQLGRLHGARPARAFKAATGIEAEVAVHATNEEIMGKLVASGGKGYDVVFVSSPFAEVAEQARPDRADRPRQGAEPRQPLSRGARSSPHDPGNTFSVPYTWGTTGPVLPLRPGEDRADQLERPARARRRAQGQDHDAGDRPLAARRRLPGQGLFGQRDRPGQASTRSRTC